MLARPMVLSGAIAAAAKANYDVYSQLSGLNFQTNLVEAKRKEIATKFYECVIDKTNPENRETAKRFLFDELSWELLLHISCNLDDTAKFSEIFNLITDSLLAQEKIVTFKAQTTFFGIPFFGIPYWNTETGRQNFVSTIITLIARLCAFEKSREKVLKIPKLIDVVRNNFRSNLALANDKLVSKEIMHPLIESGILDSDTLGDIILLNTNSICRRNDNPKTLLAIIHNILEFKNESGSKDAHKIKCSAFLQLERVFHHFNYLSLITALKDKGYSQIDIPLLLKAAPWNAGCRLPVFQDDNELSELISYAKDFDTTLAITYLISDSRGDYSKNLNPETYLEFSFRLLQLYLPQHEEKFQFIGNRLFDFEKNMQAGEFEEAQLKKVFIKCYQNDPKTLEALLNALEQKEKYFLLLKLLVLSDSPNIQDITSKIYQSYCQKHKLASDLDCVNLDLLFSFKQSAEKILPHVENLLAMGKTLKNPDQKIEIFSKVLALISPLDKEHRQSFFTRHPIKLTDYFDNMDDVINTLKSEKFQPLFKKMLSLRDKTLTDLARELATSDKYFVNDKAIFYPLYIEFLVEHKDLESLKIELAQTGESDWRKDGTLTILNNIIEKIIAQLTLGLKKEDTYQIFTQLDTISNAFQSVDAKSFDKALARLDFALTFFGIACLSVGEKNTAFVNGFYEKHTQAFKNVTDANPAFFTLREHLLKIKQISPTLYKYYQSEGDFHGSDKYMVLTAYIEREFGDYKEAFIHASSAFQLITTISSFNEFTSAAHLLSQMFYNGEISDPFNKRATEVIGKEHIELVKTEDESIETFEKRKEYQEKTYKDNFNKAVGLDESSNPITIAQWGAIQAYLYFVAYMEKQNSLPKDQQIKEVPTFYAWCIKKLWGLKNNHEANITDNLFEHMSTPVFLAFLDHHRHHELPISSIPQHDFSPKFKEILESADSNVKQKLLDIIALRENEKPYNWHQRCVIAILKQQNPDRKNDPLSTYALQYFDAFIENRINLLGGDEINKTLAIKFKEIEAAFEDPNVLKKIFPRFNMALTYFGLTCLLSRKIDNYIAFAFLAFFNQNGGVKTYDPAPAFIDVFESKDEKLKERLLNLIEEIDKLKITRFNVEKYYLSTSNNYLIQRNTKLEQEKEALAEKNLKLEDKLKEKDNPSIFWKKEIVAPAREQKTVRSRSGSTLTPPRFLQ